MERLSLLGLLLVSAASAAGVRPITEAQIARIFEREKGGAEFVPGYSLASRLGVPTSASKPYRVHFLAREFSDVDGVEHFLARSKEGGDYLIVVQTRAPLTYIHADANLNFVGAARYDRIGDEDSLAALSREEGAAALSRELTRWAAHADAK
jgi:hypothetical protein